MKKGILLLLSILFFGSLSAQNPPCIDTASVRIYFRQGHSILDRSFRDNGSCLDAFVRRISALRADTLRRIQSLRIETSASPEGSSVLNKRLSDNRSKQIVAFLRRSTGLSESLFECDSRGVDWQGLTELVEASDMPYRDEVLDILKNTPEWVIKDGAVIDGRKRQLAMLRGGYPWRYMYEQFFPELRGSVANVICTIERQPEPAPVLRDTVVVEHRDTVEIIRRDTIVVRDTVTARDTVVPVRKPFYMALKTNLLYDVALVPNIGVEFYLGRGWTVGADWMYAWWKSDKRHDYWRLYGGDLLIRKYFGRRAQEKPLTGHHLGLYGQLFTYDFETGGKGYMGGTPGGTLWDKMNYAVGVEYGYSLPIARRLNLDFTLGVGYWNGEYYEYEPVDTHYVWLQTKQRHWFGPTKAEISLVWLIGRGNYNVKKGGNR